MQSLLLHLWITMGVNSLARFDHDVIAQPRVSTVILMMGINDIGWTADGPRPGRQVRAFAQRKRGVPRSWTDSELV
jgi:lysophospholipase L1-like esterase